jgi:putative ABC transport system permease protein
MVLSFAALERVSPGFAPNHLLTLQLSLAPARCDTPQKVAAFYDALQAKLQAVPSDPQALVPPIRSAVAAIDEDLPIGRFWTMDELMAASVAAPRFRTALVSVFAVVGLLLAAIGIYGVMAYAVAERTHELGLRVALGATSRDVMRLVLVEALALAAAGLAIGLLAAFAATRLITTLLFGVAPTDPATFGSIAAVLVGTALVASYVPARRATRVDPMVALRCE